MRSIQRKSGVFSRLVVVTLSMMIGLSVAHAGSYVFGEIRPDEVTHPKGYDGNGGTLDISVCIVPGTPYAAEMARPIQNNIAIWNKLQSTTSNVRNVALPANTYDFESVSLHELGHCIGLGHPNLGSQTGVSGDNTEYTSSLVGPDNSFGFGAGADGLIGSADDVRGDDVNTHYFFAGTNNPFSEQSIVDATTYTRDLTALPVGDLFPVNARVGIGSLSRYKSPNSETVMQQGAGADELQRTLGHDDVSTLRYGMSGYDRAQGTADDYKINLVYGGIADGCDISVQMDATETGFASCRVSGQENGNAISITAANMYFDPNDDWYFNDSPPCSESLELTPFEWTLISLPCQVGVSTQSTVAAVIADDLGDNLGSAWKMFAYEFNEQADGSVIGAYRELTLADELDHEKGYWIIASAPGSTVDVQGEYNSEFDADLSVDSGLNYGWNLVGMPFRFPNVWADTRVIDPVGNVLSLSEADPFVTGGTSTACFETIGDPLPACKLGQVAFTFPDGEYQQLTPSSGAVDRFEAAWVFVGDEAYSLRFPMPVQERNSP